jgi:tryptophan 2,3-dioxygenase
VTDAAQTYSRYLCVEELLDLQRPTSDGPDGPEHDEMLFIVIHQVYELWFKQMLHELDYVVGRMAEGDTPRVRHTMNRVLHILKVCVAQLDILETMTPLEFLSFRERLESASGFQSFQFREFEFVLGGKRTSVIDNFAPGSQGFEHLTRRLSEPTLWDAFLTYLSGRGASVPLELLHRDVTVPCPASEEVQEALVHVYRSDPDAASVCERMVDLDEGVQEWRYRHVKMVERTLGNKPGTGGSSGVGYLQSTLFRAAFPDLWAIRAHL